MTAIVGSDDGDDDVELVKEGSLHLTEPQASGFTNLQGSASDWSRRSRRSAVAKCPSSWKQIFSEA